MKCGKTKGFIRGGMMYVNDSLKEANKDNVLCMRV